MLLKQATLEGIRDGRIDRQYRVWRRPTVKTDGTLTTSIGVLRVREVAETKVTALTREEARKAGFESKRALLDQLKGRDGRLYRILLELEGEDPRIALRGRALTTPEERAELEERLRRMDAASSAGPWTRRYLLVIGEHEGVRAPDLAAAEKLDTASFKARVRRLKALGLTESLRVGYRLSPRGRSFLEETPTSKGDLTHR